MLLRMLIFAPCQPAQPVFLQEMCTAQMMRHTSFSLTRQDATAFLPQKNILYTQILMVTRVRNARRKNVNVQCKILNLLELSV